MRIIIYVVLILLSMLIAWQLGLAKHGMTGNLLMLTTVLLGAYYFLTRRERFITGLAALGLGLLVPPMLWTYGEFVGGDTSSTGMIGTVLMIAFVPIGLGLVLIGWRKNKST